MDILKVKTNNSWVGIPAIKGEKGDPGDPADPTELIDDSSTTDTDKVWSAAKSFTEISDLNQSKADAIDVTDETPEAVKTIADGADGLPMALTIGIEPVQDLHGYDNPWPAGGGKNLLKTAGLTLGAPSDTSFSNATKRTFTEGTYVTGLTGNNYYQNRAYNTVVSDNSITFTTGAKAYGVSIPILGLEVGSKYTISAVTTIGFVGLSFYQQDGTFISGGSASSSIKSPYTSIVPENTYYTLVVFATTEDDTETIFSNIQLEKSDTASSFAPYSNICPISGRTGANITRTGKNLLQGFERYNTTNYVSSPIFLKAGKQYTVSFESDIMPNAIYLRKGAFNTEAEQYIYNSRQWTFTPNESRMYLFQFYKSGTTGWDDYAFSDVQLELGSTATAHEPYQGNTYSITFPQDAGTVYGGELTVNKDGTGKLVVDRASVNLGTLNYTSDGTRPNVKYTSSLRDTIMKTSPWADAICSEYKLVKNGPDGLTNGEFSTTNSYGAGNIFFKDDVFIGKTNAEVADYLSGVQLVYELATPVAYQLTDLEVIETLKGINNIWSDTGKINSVEYSADTKMYVDDAIPTIPVQDVQVNGTSVLNNGVANVPVASTSGLGVSGIDGSFGILVNNNGKLYTNTPNLNEIKAGSQGYKPIVSANAYTASFYGLAKASGDTTQSASSNPVGTYTDAAKIAIQKMLGIYQAPWELIREDTFTNAEEADHIITVDGNGNAFELTDVILMFETPVQNTNSGKGQYGQLWFHYNAAYLSTENGAWTQTANSSSHGIVSMVEQDGLLLKVSGSAQVTSTNSGNVRWRYVAGFTTAGQGIRLLTTPIAFSKVTIPKVTGTGHYILLGKRKWN